ncbi:MAG: transcription antitermination factor NusB [Rhodospirillaceae bacterium]
MTTKTKSSATSSSTARLVAVQGLYEIDITGASLDAVMMDFLDQRWTGLPDEPEMAPPDRKVFATIIRGVLGAVDNKERFERQDKLLKTILRAGVFELYQSPNVPTAVVIDEYVEMAHAFYDEKEPAFVNGVLDKLGKILRS